MNTATSKIQTIKSRALFTFAMISLSLFLVLFRSAELTLLNSASEPKISAAPLSQNLPHHRANIIDRNGVILATSLASYSLYANPREIVNPKTVAEQLSFALPEVNHNTLFNRLNRKGRFVWLKRHLSPLQHKKVHELGIPGLYFQKEQKRIYPHGRLVSHLLGYTNIDNQGIAGVEKTFEHILSDQSKPIQLSLDINAQHIVYNSLKEGIKEFHAKGGMGLVMDVNSSEIISMVSLPDFDPNKIKQHEYNHLFNQTTLGVYEMGSTFKIFTLALALESGKFNLNDGYDTSIPIRSSGYQIRDFKPKNRWLSLREIFKYSSNIGSAYIAKEIGGSQQKAFLEKLGLLNRTEIEIPEIGSPILPKRWAEINTMTISFGHGIAVNTVQMANAIAAVTNGGVYRKPTILKQNHIQTGTRVVSLNTSAEVRNLLRLVVHEGSGRNAYKKGLFIGGKTGSAEKSEGGSYNKNSLLSSFVGVFPLHNPKYLIVIMLDEPQGNESTYGYSTGGWVAAPIVRKIAENLASLYNINPVYDETENFIQTSISAME